MEFDLRKKSKDPTMENLMNKILRIIKEHVRQNNKEIQYNQEEINDLLSTGSSQINQRELEIKKDLNKELMNENKDFLKMQFEITEFIEKYGHLFSEDEITGTVDDDIHENEKLNLFYQTISGTLKFDSMHPLFDNPDFFRQLFEYYQEKEDYEMCQELLKLKELKSR